MKTQPSINRLLFAAASHFTDPEERRVFLAHACAAEPERRKRLEALLEARNDADAFFEVQPAVEDFPQAGAECEDDELKARIGPYLLLRRLGAGGCGVVYLAEPHDQAGRQVALKIIRLGMDSESVVRQFGIERRALALMDHPNIAKVLDAGTTVSGRPYFVMERVEGTRITDYCDERRLALRERLELFLQVCDAIQHAHQKGVVHRDIKPSNILVRESAGKALPMIIDFGIAKSTAGFLHDDATRGAGSAFLGTPAYMSPEQAEGGPDIDTRSDIYSLGALLCELLTGQAPFPAERFESLPIEEIRRILLEEEMPLPSLRLRAMPREVLVETAARRGSDAQRLPGLLAGDLDWIVLKALEKNRQRRYETANGLALDVRRHLAEQPVSARPPSRSYLAVKWIRRNRLLFTAAAVALSGLLSGLGASTWLFYRERQARQEQARLRVEAEKARAAEVGLRTRALAAERLSQAAVLVRYGQIAEADALLDGMTSDLVPLSLEAADTLRAVAGWNLDQSRWQTAAERFSALVPVITSVDLSDTDRMSHALMPAATAIKEWGRPDQYQALRQDALERFADTANIGVAAQVAKALLLEPGDAETLERLRPLRQLMQSAFDPAQPVAMSAYLIGWRTFSLGLFCYREGDLDGAWKWTGESLSKTGNPAQLTASNQIVRSMVLARQGRLDEARSLIEQARGVVRAWSDAPFKAGTSTDLWFDWVNARILLREADALMAKKH